MEVCFTVPGEPKGKARPRFRMARGYVRAYTPPETVAYEEKVRKAFREAYSGPESAGPMGVSITAEYSIPKRAGTARRRAMESGELRPGKKPDADNVAKAVLDALNGEAWKDDRQVAELQVSKFYGDAPAVTVHVWEV